MDGTRIKLVRKERKLTQGDVAKKLGLTTGAVSNYENNISKPSVDMLMDIAKALDVPIEYLLALDEPVGVADCYTKSEKETIQKESAYLDIIKQQQDTIANQQESLSLLIRKITKE